MTKINEENRQFKDQQQNMVSDFNEMREKLQKTSQERNMMKDRYNEMVLNHKQEKETILKLVDEQKNQYQQMKEQYEKMKDDLQKEIDSKRELRDGLNMDDQEKIKFTKKMKQLEKDLNHIQMLYRNESSARTVMHREKQMIQAKLDKKKQKLDLTKTQYQATINQLTEEKRKNQQFGNYFDMVLNLLKTEDGRKKLSSKQWLQDLRHLSGQNSPHMSFGAPLMSGSTINNRNSLMPISGSVRKTIRGGHGSVYIKGGRSSTMMMNNSMTVGDVDVADINQLLVERDQDLDRTHSAALTSTNN